MSQYHNFHAITTPQIKRNQINLTPSKKSKCTEWTYWHETNSGRLHLRAAQLIVHLLKLHNTTTTKQS